ncbi:MAG: hypothetical protein FWH55_08565 [Oscillospiraceae bacterium]|nr:hypothetical protein [Oscillospiraceae bacterium]
MQRTIHYDTIRNNTAIPTSLFSERVEKAPMLVPCDGATWKDMASSEKYRATSWIDKAIMKNIT